VDIFASNIILITYSIPLDFCFNLTGRRVSVTDLSCASIPQNSEKAATLSQLFGDRG
jgi:hypothetical protein